MKKIRDYIVNHSKLIVLITIILLIPAFIGLAKTKINYNILVYLPKDIETIKGQEILKDKFGIGGFSFVIVKNMDSYDIEALEDKIREIDSINEVISLSDVTDYTIPLDILPDSVIDKLYKDDQSVILVTFADGISDKSTMDAVSTLRKTVKDTSSVSGMSAVLLDTRALSEKEIFAYVLIAVAFCLVVLFISTDSYIIPLLLLLNIVIAIVFNMGTNIFFGEISYITKAISAVLQLGVTTDFSIFLYHKYEHTKLKEKDKKKSMSIALKETFTSVLGSCLTTVAGFLALCSMKLTLGADIGLVMAKGVIWGIISVLTLFPALLLEFDSIIEKTKHKLLLPSFKGIQKFSVKYYKFIFIAFIILLLPAWYGNKNVDVYYKLDKSLPETLDSIMANSNLKETFNIVSPEIIIVDSNMEKDKLSSLLDDLKEVKGIDMVVSLNDLMDYGFLPQMIPDSLYKLMGDENYQLIIINSTYEIASDNLSNQIDKVYKIVKSYDKTSYIAGEGPLMKDLTQISDQDFKNVNYISIAVIFIIMVFVLKSYTLPILLVFAIEFAIFVNMGLSFYLNDTLPFVTSIVIGTIQLGATIDYAILMSTKFMEERLHNDKIKAIKNTLSSCASSIITSALCFFAATVGVFLYSKIDMIGSICKLLSRGSIISMLVVILILPSLLIIFDKVICKTTKSLKEIK